MRDFKNSRISGGRGGSNFGGNRGGGGRGFGGDRDRGRPEMHKAVCSDCGSSCEVPFKPTGNKPVLCNDCFGGGRDGGRDRGRDRGRSGGRDFGRDRGRGGGRDFGGDRQMHKAVCADCGNKCEVPFKPSGDKPVLCSDCFGGNKSGGNDSSSGTQHTAILAELAELHEQQEELAGKIDKIIAFLQRGTPIKEVTVTKAEAEKATKEVKKEMKTAASTKGGSTSGGKKTTKKAPAEKAVKKTAPKKTVKKVAKKPAKKAPAKKAAKAKKK